MKMNRRRFFVAASTSYVGLNLISSIQGKNQPAVTNSRSTSGDHKFEPAWENKLTMTVGNSKKADIQGSSGKVIQAAVDYMARIGGGTVNILPGEYHLNSSIHLKSNIRLTGAGDDTILKKNEMVSSPLMEDSDWYDQEITIKNAKGFNLGDSVFITCKTENGSFNYAKRILVARNGNRFKLDKGLRKNFWLKNKSKVTNLFPLLTSENTSDVVIENLVLDGNRKNNANMNGNYGGCVFIQDCNRYSFNKLITRNYNGDGISWQICHDVIVQDCHSHDNVDLGYHPGSGSQRPIIKNNLIENNKIGIFFCWGVKFGLAENNKINGIKKYGVSIGHNDTDNIVRENTITNSGIHGILFRDDFRGKDFWPNRNLIQNNTIINSGNEQGVAIDVRGKTKEVIFQGNHLVEKRGPMKRTAIQISKNASKIQLDNNQFEGFAKNVLTLQES